MQTVRRWMLVLVLGALSMRESAAAQGSAQRDSITTKAAAESLAVLDGLTAHLQKTPGDAAAHFHLYKLAFLLANRAWVAKLPKSFTRNKTYNERGQMVELRNIGVGAMQRAVELDDQNVDYMIAMGWMHWGDREGGKANAMEWFNRAFAFFAKHPDPPKHSNLLREIGQFAWYAYEGKQFWDIPITSLGATLDPKSVMNTDYVSPKNDKQVNAAPPPTTQRGSQGTGGAGGAGAVQTGAGPGGPGKVGSSAGSNPSADIHLQGAAPVTGSTGLGIGVNSVTRAMGEEFGRLLRQPEKLPRALAVASNYANENYSLAPGQFFGEAEYLESRDFFDRAYAVLPTDERIWRAVAKHRIARSYWPELETYAQERIRLAPKDPWGWMALGIAQQRTRRSAEARISLDSGLALMPPTMRAHLDRLERVLRPTDSAQYARLDSAGKKQAQEASWQLSIPIWSIEAENPRTEFLARLAYAEMRWGELEPRMFGADTPFGRLYVRYGPPPADYNGFWLYGGGLVFAPRVTFGSDLFVTRKELEWQPARWDNIAETRIDSMPVQAARFRAADSVDFFFATRAPMDSMRKAAPANVKPTANYWLARQDAPFMFRDSLALSGAGTMQWTKRVTPGPYYYRAEAVVPGALVAGRAAAAIRMGGDSATDFSMRGFGMSDVLLATDAVAPTNVRRWSDIKFVPLTQSVRAGDRVSVIWENYDIGNANNTASYHVTMTLVRDLAAKSDVAFEFIEGASAAVKMTRGVNDFTADYDRVVPFASTIVDNLSVTFGTTPPGNYTLTVTIKDRASSRVTAKSTRITISK